MYESRVCLALLAVDIGTMYSLVYDRYSDTGALPVSVDAKSPSYNAYSSGFVNAINSVSRVKSGNLGANVLKRPATACKSGTESFSFALSFVNSFIVGSFAKPPGIKRWG